MDVTQARALIGGWPIRVEPFDPARDLRALERLAAWATRFAPFVAVDPPDGLLLDVTGCERLFGGKGRLLDAVVDAVGGLGFRARAAVARTIGCAWAVARYGGQNRMIVPAGQERAALASLPVEALRIDEGTVEGLVEVGVERIGDLWKLRRGELETRFGGELLLRLDQAMGQAMEVVEPIHPLPAPRATRVFDGPVKDLRALLQAMQGLVADVARELRRREAGALALRLELARSDLPPLRVTVSLSRPSRDRRHAASLLRPRIEASQLGFGVEGMTLVVPRTGPLPARELRAFEAEPGDGEGRLGRAAGELVDSLSARLGRERTARVEAVESHVPEQAFEVRPAMGEEKGRRRGCEAARVTPFERPSVLFASPEPIEVITLVPDAPPSSIRWRGSEHRVVTGFGPERIEEPWWKGAEGAARPARDYFRIELDRGGWLWIYREVGSDRWLVHGEWV